MSARRVAIHTQLAGLATLEATVRLAVRALHATYPELARGIRDDHRIEFTTACIVADLAEDLLLALDDHRSYVLYNLSALDSSQTAWPFGSPSSRSPRSPRADDAHRSNCRARGTFAMTVDRNDAHRSDRVRAAHSR